MIKHEPWRPYEIVCFDVYFIYELQVELSDRLDNIIFSIMEACV